MATKAWSMSNARFLTLDCTHTQVNHLLGHMITSSHTALTLYEVPDVALTLQVLYMHTYYLRDTKVTVDWFIFLQPKIPQLSHCIHHHVSCLMVVNSASALKFWKHQWNTSGIKMALCLWERRDQSWIFSHSIIDMKATIAVELRTALVMPSVTLHCYRQVGHIHWP